MSAAMIFSNNSSKGTLTEIFSNMRRTMTELAPGNALRACASVGADMFAVRRSWKKARMALKVGWRRCSALDFLKKLVVGLLDSCGPEGAVGADSLAWPGGSVIGCPKVRTLELLNQQEKENRNIFTGSFGYIKFNKDMRFNIIIRSILNYKNTSEISAASGVVLDSAAKKEFNENFIKAKSLLELFK